jgi:hypothetical protein
LDVEDEIGLADGRLFPEMMTLAEVNFIAERYLHVPRVPFAYSEEEAERFIYALDPS